MTTLKATLYNCPDDIAEKVAEVYASSGMTLDYTIEHIDVEQFETLESLWNWFAGKYSDTSVGGSKLLCVDTGYGSDKARGYARSSPAVGVAYISTPLDTPVCTVAHELAHTFGAGHDSEILFDGSINVMLPSSVTIVAYNALYFTDKTRREIMDNQMPQGVLGLPLYNAAFRGISYYVDLPGGNYHTYDGHKGTDFMVSNRYRGVANVVLNPYTGYCRVQQVHTGESNDPDPKAGNGLGNFVWLRFYTTKKWEEEKQKQSIYAVCAHLESDSILVKQGDILYYRQPIGRVSLSGRTDIEHPHVHIGLTWNGRTLCPVRDGLFNAEAMSIVTHKNDAFNAELLINNRFAVQATRDSIGYYVFTADKPIKHLWHTENPHGVFEKNDIIATHPEAMENDGEVTLKLHHPQDAAFGSYWFHAELDDGSETCPVSVNMVNITA
jgi:hypothetical protein